MKIELAIVARDTLNNGDIDFYGKPVWSTPHISKDYVHIQNITIDLDIDQESLRAAVINGEIEKLREQQAEHRSYIKTIEERIQSLLAIEHHETVS